MAEATCRVTGVGPAEDGTIDVRLVSIDGVLFQDARWFRATPGREREVLATALAAMTSGNNVWVSLKDANAGASSYIDKIYVVTR